MLEAARSGMVPDTGPPVTNAQEAAMRPMCDQLKEDIVSHHQSRMAKYRDIRSQL
jgi:hypothetical protein